MKFIDHMKTLKLSFDVKEVIKVYHHSDSIYFLTDKGKIFILNIVSGHISSAIIQINVDKKEKLYKFVDFFKHYVAYVIDDCIKIFDLKNFVEVEEFNCRLLFGLNYINVIKLNNNHIFVGTETGKVALIFTKTKNIEYLARMKEYIECIDVNNSSLAYTSYDGRLRVIDIYSGEVYYDGFISRLKPTYMAFIDENTIIIQDTKGFVFFLTLNDQKIKNLVNTISSFIIDTFIFNDYIFINTNNTFEELLYVDNKLRIKSEKYLGNKLLKVINSLICFFEEKDFIQYESVEKKVQILLNNKEAFFSSENLYQAYQIIDTNLFLKNREQFKSKIDTLFQMIVFKATVLFENQEMEKVKKVLKVFEKLEKCTISLAELKQRTTAYQQFKQMYQNQTYHLCYDLARKHEFLKITAEYIELETKFKKIFQTIYSNYNKQRNFDYDELVSPFIKILEKRRYLQFLMDKINLFETFCKIVEQRNYRLFFILVQDNEELTLLDEYEVMKKEIDILYKKTEKITNEEETHQAIIILKNDPLLKEEMIIKENKLKEYLFFEKHHDSSIYVLSNMNNKYILTSSIFRDKYKDYLASYDEIKSAPKTYSKKHILDKFKMFSVVKEKEIIDLIKFQYIKSIYKDEEKKQELVNKYVSLCGYDFHIEEVIDNLKLEKPEHKKRDISLDMLPDFLV